MKRKIKIILVMVTSANGKSTKGNTKGAAGWASKEDQVYFRSLIAENSLLVQGRRTYEIARPTMKLMPGKRRLVITRNPKEFKKYAIPGQLEFTDESPAELVKRMEKNGYKRMILLGGSNINSLFFKEKLVDELWLTLEPKVFGTGKGLVDEGNFEVALKLKEIKRLNKKGTLLLQYTLL